MPQASPVRSPTKISVPRSEHGQRADPAPRSVSGNTMWMFGLLSARADRHYTWANNADNERGLEFYKQLGYAVERWSADGVRPRGERGQEGAPIERMGHTLVSIDRAEREQLERFGLDGEGGLELTARRQQAIRDPRAGNALLRGIPGIRGSQTGDPIMRVHNETTELELE